MRLIVREIKAQIRAGLTEAIRGAQADEVLPVFDVGEIQLSVPKESNHGDLAANIAMIAAKPAKMPPVKIAGIIKDRFRVGEPVARLEIAGPGFLNFFLTNTCREEAIREIIAQGTSYGRTEDLTPQRIQVEFISANPVGPLNVVNCRAGALGDSLAGLLAAAGAAVEREYYVNDFGVQVWTLGRSVEARCRELLGLDVEFPEEGYQGEYIYDHARAFLERAPVDFWRLGEEERIAMCREFALRRILAEQQADLADYGVHYDRWFSERSLHESGAVSGLFSALVAGGHTYEAEGAVWLKTTDFGDDKDRVIKTGDGRTTYLLADIAYHLDKLKRGFDHLIDIWGPDHHGHVIRMQAALAAAGVDPRKLEILIAQQINLLRDGQPVKMSKRAGNFITMRELLGEVGNDVARYFFLTRSAESHLDFDLDLAVAESNENPVYYIQYAHARVASILRQAAEQNIDAAGTLFPGGLLRTEEELRLADAMLAFPELLAEAAIYREPHRVTGYLLDLAGLFHGFYNKHRVLTEDASLTAARLALVKAVQITIANGLRILGLHAPEKM